MQIQTILIISGLMLPVIARSQQANVNLDYNPQKNTENLIPFSASLNSPDVHDDGTVTFKLKAPTAKEVRLSGPVLTALGKETRTFCFRRPTTEYGPLALDRLSLKCTYITSM